MFFLEQGYFEKRKQNKQKLKHKKAEYRQRIRKEVREYVINAYGGKCTCCGESNPSFLTIDHVNGRIKGEEKTSGLKMWKIVKDTGCTKEFTILCFNCNCGKSDSGICPHKLNK